ncbi:Peptidyl-prolyl cis-trans isomerase [Quillaja saponaria]|uniref:Peptidyl-prolyl cis-trans isomerase n=1 Tax=Quillaja saponaria TaxID=32244 RepID=A0AAD7KWB1_QUISA|nr:Peptidyl-prolyl cis-trans isomerase [Quillaja saponaria]
MKGASRSNMSKSATKRNEGYFRYLKPGALAQIRDSKITARSQRHGSHTRVSLYQLSLPTATPTFPSFPIEQNDMSNQIDGIPCFALRINRPRCLQRKKLFAVTPVFTQMEQS